MANRTILRDGDRLLLLAWKQPACLVGVNFLGVRVPLFVWLLSVFAVLWKLLCIWLWLELDVLRLNILQMLNFRNIKPVPSIRRRKNLPFAQQSEIRKCL